MKTNKEWHTKNPMTKHPTFQQKLEWHLAHVKHKLLIEGDNFTLYIGFSVKTLKDECE
jgi:hypothetical protein